jgi:hypothetical protein
VDAPPFIADDELEVGPDAPLAELKPEKFWLEPAP